MLNLILKRILHSILTLFTISIITFIIINKLPGSKELDYLRANPAIKLNKEDRAKLRKELGLDKPIYIQYLKTIKSIFKGELGWSEKYESNIKDLLPQRIYTSLKLTLPAFILTLIFAIMIAMLLSNKHNKSIDIITRSLTILGSSIPTFWLGLIMLYIFSMKLAILPSAGISDIGKTGFINQIKHLIMPVMVLSVNALGNWIRYLRTGILDIMKLEYIQTAIANGIPEDKILFKHVFKNILIMLITLITLTIPSLVGGALITEEIFSIPGMGQLLYKAILHQDRQLVFITFLIISVIVVVLNFIADLLYFFIDPRISK